MRRSQYRIPARFCLFGTLLLGTVLWQSCNGWDDDPTLYPTYAYSVLLLEDEAGNPALYRATTSELVPFQMDGLHADDRVTSITLQDQVLYAAIPSKQEILALDLRNSASQGRYATGGATSVITSSQQTVSAAGGGRIAIFPIRKPDRIRQISTALQDSLVLPGNLPGLFFFAGKDGNRQWQGIVVDAEALAVFETLPLKNRPIMWQGNNLLSQDSAGGHSTTTYNILLREFQASTPVSYRAFQQSPIVKRPYEREFVGNLFLFADSTLALEGLPRQTAVEAISLDSWGSQIFYTQTGQLHIYNANSQSLLGSHPLPAGYRLIQGIHHYAF